MYYQGGVSGIFFSMRFLKGIFPSIGSLLTIDLTKWKIVNVTEQFENPKNYFRQIVLSIIKGYNTVCEQYCHPFISKKKCNRSMGKERT